MRISQKLCEAQGLEYKEPERLVSRRDTLEEQAVANAIQPGELDLKLSEWGLKMWVPSGSDENFDQAFLLADGLEALRPRQDLGFAAKSVDVTGVPEGTKFYRNKLLTNSKKALSSLKKVYGASFIEKVESDVWNALKN